MSAQDVGGTPSRARGSSPSRPSTSSSSEAAFRASAGPSTSSRKEPSLGIHAPGITANPRRARSIHINIKPDPAPSVGLALPSWLSGATGPSIASSSNNTPAGQVPHRDFGMSPHRRASDSHSHARALSATSARNNSISAGPSSIAGAGIGQSASERWAGTIRNQMRHIERDGLRGAFWNRRTLGSNATAGQSYLAKTWDRIRRIPELLLVEYEDPVEPSSPWRDNADEHESSDTSDLLDEDGQTASRPRKVPHGSRKKPGHLKKAHRLLDRARRALGVSRAALVLLTLLLVLGIYESTKLGSASTRNTLHHDPSSLKINTKDPFATLRQAGVEIGRASSPLAESSQAVGSARGASLAQVPSSARAKVTAIVLNWKRTDNLVVILAHLCSYTNTIFDTVHVWNNNPDTFLTQATFAASRCPKGKLRIHNSPGNLLFMSRFMACALADTPHCYFQDDDWLVPSLPAGHAHFMRNPDGPPVILTGEEFPEKEGWEWCFFNSDFEMNTCFAWLGTGSFVSRARVLQTLESATLLKPSLESGRSTVLGPLASDELAMLDNSFTIFQNAPPYVLAGELVPMPQPVAFTAGDGTAGDVRNDIYIQKGLDRLSSSLGVLPNLSPYPPPVQPWPVDISHTSQTLYPFSKEAVPHRPHTYWHHSRSIAQESDRIFVTSVANLPPPDAVVYQPHAGRNFSQWQHEVGNSPDLWKEGKDWALAWGYYEAVDGDYRTAWRSPDIIRKDDYIGLDLLTQIQVDNRPAISVQIVMEDAATVIDQLKLEVSTDGYNWRELAPKPVFTCHMTGHLSTQPHPSFRKTFLTSSSALEIIRQETSKGSKKPSWSKPRTRLESCEVTLSTSAGGARRKGWRFVRLKAEKDMNVGWGVYEMWMS